MRFAVFLSDALTFLEVDFEESVADFIFFGSDLRRAIGVQIGR